MELLNLIESIKLLDKKLLDDYEIFENEKSKLIHEKVYENNINQIQILRGYIVFFFLRNKIEEKQALWDIVTQYKEFLDYLSFKYEIDNNREFKHFLILQIYANLHLDPRENFMYFGEILKNVKENKNIEIKTLIEEVLPLADENDWSGMGSMKTFLENVIKHNL